MMIKIHPITGEITLEYDIGAGGTRYTLDRNASITAGSGFGIFEDAAYGFNE